MVPVVLETVAEELEPGVLGVAGVLRRRPVSVALAALGIRQFLIHREGEQRLAAARQIPVVEATDAKVERPLAELACGLGHGARVGEAVIDAERAFDHLARVAPRQNDLALGLGRPDKLEGLGAEEEVADENAAMAWHAEGDEVAFFWCVHGLTPS